MLWELPQNMLEFLSGYLAWQPPGRSPECPTPCHRHGHLPAVARAPRWPWTPRTRGRAVRCLRLAALYWGLWDPPGPLDRGHAPALV